ncbi:nuclear protein MDM1-like [Glandiceps talaboti]
MKLTEPEGSSEYKTHYKWVDSRKSASFSPAPEQMAPDAGIKSAQLSFVRGEQREPPLQHKRYPVNPSSKITNTTKMYLQDPSEDSTDVAVPINITSKKTPIIAALDQTRPVVQDNKTAPIDKRDKSKTYKLEPKKDKAKTYKIHVGDAERIEKKTKPEKAEVEVKEKVKVAEKENVAKNLEQNGLELGFKYRAGFRRKDKGPKRLSEYQRQFAWKAPVHKESPLIAAEQMIYNSNAIPAYMPEKVAKKSEYEAQFQAWNQVQPTQQEMLKEHAKKDIEVKQKKKVSRGKRKKSSPKASPDQMPAAGVPSLDIPEQLKVVENPQKPFFPHGATKKWKSEYRSNYRDPRVFGYMEGVWRGADPPHIQPRDDSSDKVQPVAKEADKPVGGAPEWFAEVRRTPKQFSVKPQQADKDVKEGQDVNWFKEVVELRKKAQEYQKRARGTHFSREHLAQLLAQQARLWDQESEVSSSTLTPSESQPRVKPSKETAAKQQAELARQEEAPSPKPIEERATMPVKRRLAWPQDKARQENESSIGSIPTPEGYHSHTSPRDSQATIEDSTETEGGRVPTPRLTTAVEKEKARHHLARTTPAVGGAILSSPSFKANKTSTSKKSPPAPKVSRARSTPPPQRRQHIKPPNIPVGQLSDGYRSDDEESDATGNRRYYDARDGGHGDGNIECNCGADNVVCSQLHKSPSAGMETQDPDPLSSHYPSSPFLRHSENYYETSPARPRLPDDRSQLRKQKTWAGIALERNRNGSTAKSPETTDSDPPPPPRKPAEAWSIPTGPAVTSKPAEPISRQASTALPATPPPRPEGRMGTWDDEDAWSVLSSRSSCSLASEVLERARKRRDEFWGKK